MQRPTGVTVIAILQFIGAGFMVLGGFGLMLGMGMLGTVLAQRGNGGMAGMGVLAGMGAVLGVVVLFFAAIEGLIAWGMWNLKSWARIVTIVFAGLGGAFQALGLMASLIHFHIFGLLWNALWLGVNGLIIWYLVQPEVVQAFEGDTRAQAVGR